MLRCSECGLLFEESELKKWVETHDFWGGTADENWTGCPCCSGNYEEIEPCKICGSFEHDVDDDYCDECKKAIHTRFSDFVDNQFTDDERELLNKLYEGEWI